MALLTPQAISATGLGATYAPATSGGDKVQVAGNNLIVHVKNGAASAVTVTITTQANTYKGLTVADRIVSVPASSDRFIGPLDPAMHADINGQVSVGYSAVATVTVAALYV